VRHATALSLVMLACTMTTPASTRPWSMPPEGEAIDVSRRWPARVPIVDGVHDVEHYRLRHGGTVLFVRFRSSLDEATRSLLHALSAERWRLLEHHGAGRLRTISGCAPDCDDARFYVVLRQELAGRVYAILRLTGPGESTRRVRLPEACQPVALAQDLELHRDGGVQPVRVVDLDRDGRLDAFVPRRVTTDAESRVVWDALVMRDGCGHRVGTFTDVPYDDHFAPVGPHGLIDLTVRSRQPDGERVVERMQFTGTRYVVSSPP
jgi:hypothetical protein